MRDWLNNELETVIAWVWIIGAVLYILFGS
jgi:hypothetical protein